MALKVVLALAVVALAAAQDGGYNYDAPVRTFNHFAPVRAVVDSSEEDGYDYQQPARTFTHRTPKPVSRPVIKYTAPVRAAAVSSEEDGYDYQQPARTFTHQAPVRVAVKPRKVYVAPAKPVAKPVVKYVAPAVESSEEDGYNYQQPARTFSHQPPTRVVAARPKNTYVAPTRPKNTYVAPTTQAPKPVNSYQAPRNTYQAPESDEVLDYEPTNPEYNQRYEVADDETGAQFNHEEERDGAQTRGSYSVALPDGRVQTVTYYVNGDGGFVAEVTYDGEAQYPPEPEGGYGPWEGPTAGPPVLAREYAAPSRTVAVVADSSEEVARPRGLYSAPRA